MKEQMKHFLLTLLALVAISMAATAEEKEKSFSPEKFQADMEQFIATEAQLTADDAARFFPVYREKGEQQRRLYHQQQQIGRQHPKGEDACRQAIEQSDRLEIEIKQLQQQYHRRFLEILPAEKVYRILKAETRFHHRALRGGNGKRHAPKGSAKKRKQ